MLLLFGGLVHLQLYFSGYRSIDKIGPSFLMNAIASAVVAAALVARKEWLVRVAGIAIASGTLVAFAISRQGDGLFDFREQGLKPSPQAIFALLAEIAALVLLAVSLLPSVINESEQPSRSIAILSTGISAVAMIGLGVYWANHYDSTVSALGAANHGGVQIANFAFGPADLTVSSGTTVTWTNGDGVKHTVVASDRAFKSNNLGKGATFEQKFDTAGQFAYVCGIHPQMRGTITVTG